MCFVLFFFSQPPPERVVLAAGHRRGPEEHPERARHRCRPPHRLHPHQGRPGRPKGDVSLGLPRSDIDIGYRSDIGQKMNIFSITYPIYYILSFAATKNSLV